MVPDPGMIKRPLPLVYDGQLKEGRRLDPLQPLPHACRKVCVLYHRVHGEGGACEVR